MMMMMGDFGSYLSLKLSSAFGDFPDLVVQSVESLGRLAFHVEPPVAGESLLIVDGAIGAEERDGSETLQRVRGTHPEHLKTDTCEALVPSCNGLRN